MRDQNENEQLTMEAKPARASDKLFEERISSKKAVAHAPSPPNSCNYSDVVRESAAAPHPRSAVHTAVSPMPIVPVGFSPLEPLTSCETRSLRQPTLVEGETESLSTRDLSDIRDSQCELTPPATTLPPESE